MSHCVTTFFSKEIDLSRDFLEKAFPRRDCVYSAEIFEADFQVTCDIGGVTQKWVLLKPSDMINSLTFLIEISIFFPRHECQKNCIIITTLVDERLQKIMKALKKF